MDEIVEILTSTATRLFDQEGGDAAARLARQGELPAGLWTALEAAGLPLALLSEDQGGFGLDPAAALNLIRIGSRFGSAAPLGETMLANSLLANAGLAVADGPATFGRIEADMIERDGAGWRVSGKAFAVPWARHATTIVLLGANHVVRLAVGEGVVTPGAAISGLPRDDLAIDITLGEDRVVERAGAIDAFGPAGALMRALEMAGALQTVLAITGQYANERVQFGKPIAKLQAIQQQIAVLAGQAAAANAAADLAAQSWGKTLPVAAIAVAKARAGEAAGIGAAIAHQVLGAIGFTEEHRLHLFTKALWTWRDEYGGERVWQRLLGASALGAKDGFWPFVTQQGVLGEAA